VKTTYNSVRIAILSFVILLFSSCTQSKDWSDPNALAEKAISDGAFSEILEPLPNAQIGFEIYGLDSAKYSNAVFYISTGATAEEFVYLKAIDGDSYDRAIEAINKRLQSQTEIVKGYNPAEIPKLEHARILTDKSQNIVILCVADDYDKLSIE
jgi:hypothetical protein